MKFRPLHDRVLLKRIDQEERTSGGIIIPDTAQEKPMEGEVVAVLFGASAVSGDQQFLEPAPLYLHSRALIVNREITEGDIVRLTEIKIKRISRFDSFKADEAMKKLLEAPQYQKYLDSKERIRKALEAKFAAQDK